MGLVGVICGCDVGTGCVGDYILGVMAWGGSGCLIVAMDGRERGGSGCLAKCC